MCEAFPPSDQTKFSLIIPPDWKTERTGLCDLCCNGFQNGSLRQVGIEISRYSYGARAQKWRVLNVAECWVVILGINTSCWKRTNTRSCEGKKIEHGQAKGQHIGLEVGMESSKSPRWLWYIHWKPPKTKTPPQARLLTPCGVSKIWGGLKWV